jgi:hypothetical protein
LLARVDFLPGLFSLLAPFDGLRVNNQSKRDSSTSQADNFAGAKLKKKRRLAPVGMTGLGGWLRGWQDQMHGPHPLLLIARQVE